MPSIFMSAITFYGSIPDPTHITYPLTAGQQWVAIWLSPVNPDACFAAAGWTEFGDQDAAWEADAAAFQARLLTALEAQFGAPQLLSSPLRAPRKWWSRQPAPPLALSEQVSLPMAWDHLPDCLLAFGTAGVSLRTGKGHHLYWLTLPQTVEPAAWLSAVAGDLPLRRGAMQWAALLKTQH